MLLYTDGLTEARRDGKLFGLEGVSAVLGELEDPSPSEAVASLRARVAEFADGDASPTTSACSPPPSSESDDGLTDEFPAAAGLIHEHRRPGDRDR